MPLEQWPRRPPASRPPSAPNTHSAPPPSPPLPSPLPHDQLIFPVVALGLKAVLSETPKIGGGFKAIPDGVAAFAVEGMYKVAKVKLSR